MKILQVTPYFYPSSRGQELYAFTLAKSLVRLGHKVDILTINTENVEKQGTLWGSTTIYRCPKHLGYQRWVFSLSFVKNLIGKKDYDVCHIQIPFQGGLETSILASKINDIPLVASHHGQCLEGSASYALLITLYDVFYRKFSLRYIDRIIFFTHSYAKSLQLDDAIKKRMRIVRPGIDVDKFFARYDASYLRERLDLDDEDRVILHIGSLPLYNRFRNIDLLISALQKVKKKIPKSKIVVVGGGELVNELKRIANQLRLEQDVVFTGHVNSEEIAPFYSLCDVYVQPSSFESFGYSVLEAMASEKPVIVANVAGMKDNVEHGKTGLLVPPKNIDALANAIIYLLENETLRTKMGENARMRALDYSIDRMTIETTNVFKEAIQEHMYRRRLPQMRGNLYLS